MKEENFKVNKNEDFFLSYTVMLQSSETLQISLAEGAAAAAKSLQLCPTLCDPIDYSLPGSSIHGIFQARVLEWVPLPSLEDLYNRPEIFCVS